MLEEDPGDQLLRYMLAMELDKDGDHSRSLELLQALMNDNEAYVPAFVMAGQQQARQENTEAARSIFQAGIEAAHQQGDEHAAGEMTQFLHEL